MLVVGRHRLQGPGLQSAAPHGLLRLLVTPLACSLPVLAHTTTGAPGAPAGWPLRRGLTCRGVGAGLRPCCCSWKQGCTRDLRQGCSRAGRRPRLRRRRRDAAEERLRGAAAEGRGRVEQVGAGAPLGSTAASFSGTAARKEFEERLAAAAALQLSDSAASLGQIGPELCSFLTQFDGVPDLLLLVGMADQLRVAVCKVRQVSLKERHALLQALVLDRQQLILLLEVLHAAQQFSATEPKLFALLVARAEILKLHAHPLFLRLFGQNLRSPAICLCLELFRLLLHTRISCAASLLELSNLALPLCHFLLQFSASCLSHRALFLQFDSLFLHGLRQCLTVLLGRCTHLL
mmetsp:Transcript_89812/g.226608  ORF Transcript_89812/g.226608 Transcript_89812/m.226608 type:complete len:348 (+) Transcript_89812:370-1413(+)